MKDFKYWIIDETAKVENDLFMFGDCCYTKKEMYDIYLKLQNF
jgi:hypothetical protein